LKATEVLARIFLKAGASRAHCFGFGAGKGVFRNEKDVDLFMSRPWKPSDFFISAWHPLGTTRMAADKEQGVCDVNHKVFGYEGLYVMDGGVVPSSLGVNPQVTIMAMAMRAAHGLADELNGKAGLS